MTHLFTFSMCWTVIFSIGGKQKQEGWLQKIEDFEFWYDFDISLRSDI